MCRFVLVCRGSYGYVWVCKSEKVEIWKIVKVEKGKSGKVEKWKIENL